MSSILSTVRQSYDVFVNATQVISQLDTNQTTEAFETLYQWSHKCGIPCKIPLFTVFPDQAAAKLSEYVLYKLPEQAAYHLPKMAVEGAAWILEGTPSAAYWATKNVYDLAAAAPQGIYNNIPNLTNYTPTIPPPVRIFSKVIYKLTPDLSSKPISYINQLSETLSPVISTINSTVHENFNMFSNFTADQMNQLSHRSTSWVTGKTVEQITKECANQAVEAAVGGVADPVFNAFDLLGPAISLFICTNKSQHYLSEALHHAKLLRTGKRLTKSLFISYAVTNNSLEGGNVVQVTKNKPHTSIDLIGDIALNAILSGLWGAAAYFTQKGIHTAVETASNSSQAALVTNALLIAAMAAPSVYACYEWLNQPSGINLSSPTIAPHLVYTDQGPQEPKEEVGLYPLDEIVTEPDIEKEQELLPFKDVVARLKTIPKNPIE